MLGLTIMFSGETCLPLCYEHGLDPNMSPSALNPKIDTAIACTYLIKSITTDLELLRPGKVKVQKCTLITFNFFTILAV